MPVYVATLHLLPAYRFDISRMMELSQAAARFAALAHPVRLKLFQTLAREGVAGLPAGALAERAHLPASTLSFHLRELTDSGLLAATRKGRHIHYALRSEAVRELIWFVGEDCCQGRRDLVPAPTSRIEQHLAGEPGERPDAAQHQGPKEAISVLFLCTHNSARSQMAEALLRHLAEHEHGARPFVVRSAGVRPRDIHPCTLKVLKEIGVASEALCSTDLGELLGKVPIDTAIVLCPEAQQDCPEVVPFARHVAYWPFEDPAAVPVAGSSVAGSSLFGASAIGASAPGPQELRRFRAVRDQILARLRSWVLEQAKPKSARARKRTGPRQNKAPGSPRRRKPTTA